MDKIEKLKNRTPLFLFSTEEELEHIRNVQKEFRSKLNEIIDVLNGELSKPRIQVKSQTQPEGCGHDFDLNNSCTRCGVRGVRDMTLEPYKITVSPTKVRIYPKLEVTEKPCSEKVIKDVYVEYEPEKQEEWREELRNEIGKAQKKYSDFKRNEQMLSGSVEIYLKTRNYVEEEVVDNILDKLDQLLSERTRESKKEVLEKILEKKTNYKIKREEHGYRVTLEYVLADDIEKELDNIKQSNNNG